MARAACALVACAFCGALASASAAPAAGPLSTALDDPYVFSSPSTQDLAFARVRSAGARLLRVVVIWRSVAPASPPPADPSNPADPRYYWSTVDRQVRLAVAHGLNPILTIVRAPDWAEGEGSGAPGTNRPDPVEFGRFARAAAIRYSGRFIGLPRVRHWQAWSEPNLHLYLNPQLENDRPVSPAWYRTMVTEFARAIHSVHRDNVLVAGGLAPFRDHLVANRDWGPLTFMREFFCLSRKLKPICKVRVPFDVWSHHPYTSGGPTRHAELPDDVSLGDLPELRRVLMAAYRAGHIVSKGPPELWVTEFSWDSKPPDPMGVPTSLQTRWVAEALYRMWKNGVSVVTWFMLRDEPVSTSLLQSGLYYRGSTFERDRPKPALRAFRFPFVGFPRGNGVYVWGRTPAGTRGRVLVEQSWRGGSWRRLGVIRTDRHGIFQRRFAGSRLGWVRARMLGTQDKAVPFSLKHVPDRFFNPFGRPTLPGR